MKCINKKELNLSNEIRLLWEQHVAWTRMAIRAIIFELPDENLTIQRLLRNPVDFGFALRPYYGDANAFKFKELLTVHLTLAADLVRAAKAGDTAAAEVIEKKWYENADEIAEFLGSINPFWDVEKWREMLYEHLGFVKAEAVYMLEGNYAASIDTYDKMELQILEMADYMTCGIIRQFPRKFC